MIERIGGPDRDRTDDLFHAMEARSQLRHRPTYGGMQLFYCLRWGLIRQTLAVAGFEPRPGWNPAPSRPRQRSPGGPRQRRYRPLQPAPGRQNLRDREHLWGVPVSKTIEGARHSV